MFLGDRDRVTLQQNLEGSKEIPVSVTIKVDLTKLEFEQGYKRLRLSQERIWCWRTEQIPHETAKTWVAHTETTATITCDTANKWHSY